MNTIIEVVAGMDIMLSQVLIETVILEISLGDGIEAGIDWIQRSRVLYDGGEPYMGYAGSTGTSGTRPTPGLGFNAATDFPVTLGSGLSYYLTFFDLNIDMVVRAAMNDSKTHIHSTPMVMTQDNKEAEIKATRQIYVYKGKKYAGDAAGSPVYEDDVERQDVGLTLTVTPRINENRFVVMNVKQSIENVGGKQIINETEWPIITKREIGADIAVESGQTIVLGGLVLDNRTENTRKVPILGSIPVLGWLFKSKSVTTSRDEVLVFLTPYVLNTPEEIRAEALRRRDSIDSAGWERGWTGSSLAHPQKGSKEAKASDTAPRLAEPGFGVSIPLAASADVADAAAEGDAVESVE